MEPGKNKMDPGGTLEQLHGLQLKIALEIRRVCEKNGLRCFLVYGSLLGAVRHGGFIPWDDDMDMGMLRADYDAFLEACKTDLRPEFLLQTWDTDPSYPFPAGKIRLKGTHTAERFAPGDGEDGIYVDIFPFDAVPDGMWARHVNGWLRFAGKRLLWMKKGYGRCIREESRAQRLKYAVAAAVVRFIPYAWLKRCMERTLLCRRGRRTRFVAAPGEYPFAKECIEPGWAGDLEPVAFGGERFPAFRASDAYLRKLYGDYMTPPPPEKRHTHELGPIDFGPYGPVG